MAIEVATRQIRGLVVSHTHWDREWYLSFQRFRMQLVDTVDALLDILDHDPSFRYFTLDGQTVVLEDYLEIRPETEARLACHIKDGRLLIGPWYVLPDEFLVSAESLVRNLLVGRQVARRFGEPMPVGYLPDTFGHPAQLPQILRRWGFDNAVLFRGVIPPAAEFLWEAPDGSRVLTVFLPGGYCNAAGFTAGPDRFLQERLDELVATLRSAATTPNILLMSGCDHFPARGSLAGYIDRGNARLEDVILEQGTLPQFVERLKAAEPKLEVLKGEFRRPRPGRITPGVLSARMYLKQENFRTTTMLERYAEPLCALAWLTGLAHPDAYLTYAWKQLLQNHPHDSICGCSIDPVHRDMLTRFHYAQDVAGELVRRSLAEVASRVATAFEGGEGGFIAFNPTGRRRTDYGRQSLHFFERGREFQLIDSGGNPVPHQVIARRPVVLQYRTVTQSIEIDGQPIAAAPVIGGKDMAKLVQEGVWQRWEGEEVEVLFRTNLPPCGFATYRVAPDAPADGFGSDLRAGEDWLENALLRLEVDPHGQVALIDKRSNVVYGPLHVFEDGGDRGDEYTYCPPADDVVLTSAFAPATVRLVETGPVRATIEIGMRLRVPGRLAPDRRSRDDRSVELAIASRVSLIAGSPRVEFVTAVLNAAEDHRLRVLFTTPMRTDWSHARGQFEVTRRAIDLDPAEVGRVPGNDEEVAVTTFPQADFVDVNDGERGLAVLNRGLPEFEALRADGGTSVALTLLRCVGWLSRTDLATRAGNAGPMLATPEAQCLGKHVFEYAVVPHHGDWAAGRVAEEAAQFTAPPVGSSLFGRTPRSEGEGSPLGTRLPHVLSLVAVQPPEVALSAVKKAADDGALVVRVYNTIERPVAARIAFGWPVREVVIAGLGENDLGRHPLAVDDTRAVTFDLGAHEIRTLLVR